MVLVHYVAKMSLYFKSNVLFCDNNVTRRRPNLVAIVT